MLRFFLFIFIMLNIASVQLILGQNSNSIPFSEMSIEQSINEANAYSIKAMFLINFFKYKEWPQEALKTVFKIGVVGNSEMYDELIKIPALKTKDLRSIIITKISKCDLSEQEIIFISQSENKRLNQVVKKFNRKGVLVISEDVRLPL